MELTDRERRHLEAHWSGYLAGPGGMPPSERTLYTVQHRADQEEWEVVSLEYGTQWLAEAAARMIRARTGSEVRVVSLRVEVEYIDEVSATIEAHAVAEDAEADARAAEHYRQDRATRVARGAQTLDKDWPGLAERASPEKLDMSDAGADILHQGVRQPLELGVPPSAPYYEYMEIYGYESMVSSGYEPAPGETYEELTEAWVAHLEHLQEVNAARIRP